MTLILLLIAGCGAPKSEPTEFLAGQYGPLSSPAYLARMGIEPQNLIRAEGDERRQVITGPNGKQYALRWRKVSESIGRPGAGRLEDGARLPKRGAGFIHNGRHPFGTDETVAYLRFAAWMVTQLYPGTAPVVIQDLSATTGGYLPPHKSHRSGRDVDVGWYRTNNTRMKWFKALPADQLDVAKSWTFIETLLRTGSVKYIFVDRSIQALLYSHALGEGWDRKALNSIFQHPTGSRRAIIRHVRGHKNHLHVRFRCPPEDESCES